MYSDRPKFGPEQFTSGDIIIQQGDQSDKFYIITKGTVEVLHRDDLGNEIVMNRLQTGQYFGEIGLVKESRRVATVRAMTDVELMSMDRNTFDKWVGSSKLIQEELNVVMSRRIAERDQLKPTTGLLGQNSKFPETEEKPKKKVTSPLSWPSKSTHATGPQSFMPHDVIVEGGEIADKFYIIVEGEVEVVRETPGKKELHLATLSNGDYFGEIGLLTGEKRIASVRAKTMVRVIALDRETFTRWMEKSPSSRDHLERTAARRRADTGRLIPPDERG